jgi:phthalate 4,5-cis-dihydrodiol dehydrogenase
VTASTTPIRFGIAGLGTAGLAFIPPIKANPAWHLAAVAEPDADVRAALAAQHGAAGYPDLDAMLAHPELDAVIIATPTPLHAAQARAAFAAGKHVVLEKPMATDLAAALAIVEAAEAAGLVLLIGHSHSFDLPIQAMHQLIEGGTLGRVRMIHTWCFSDWIYRPRRPDELEVATGGGVTLRQGAHQFDIIRLLGGGALRSIKAHTFDWDPARRAIGAHTAHLEFADGAVATAVYNGYGGLATSELTAGITEWGFTENMTVPSKRVAPADVAQAKRRRADASDKSAAPFQPHFGLTVVSCEGGDIRQSPTGLIVYSAAGRQEIDLPAGQIPHALLLAEFHDAVRGIRPALHDGRWGLANLEACLAAIQSAETGEAVMLQHQFMLPPRPISATAKP